MIWDLMDELEGVVDSEFKDPVEVVDVGTFPDVDQLALEVRRWQRLKDLYCVSVDLRNSTALDVGAHASTSASLYEAVTGSCAKIVKRLNPQFVDIQGDGLFALFHGAMAVERAICAAISLKTFGERVLEPMIEKHRAEKLGERFPQTGLKIGVASGTTVVKRVGVRTINEPVWAGRAVPYAVKASETCEPKQLLVTQAVHNRIAGNEYLTWSCGCDGAGNTNQPKRLWAEAAEMPGVPGMMLWSLGTTWCRVHGDAFYDAVLAGSIRRDDIRG
ncbi:MAG: hypothetical protein Q7W51_04910 [Coriobacteriia bacterium]|nr:hypothetical protein [Coriobacteriia bacterium]